MCVCVCVCVCVHVLVCVIKYSNTLVGRTPLDKWSARRRDLYQTKHNNHNTQTFMPPVGLEHTISAGERLQTYALGRAATGICQNL